MLDLPEASGFRPTLIVADDDPGARSNLQQRAEVYGLFPEVCSTVKEANDAIDRILNDKSQVLIGVISDLKISNESDDGWGVLGHAYKTSKSIKLALFTGHTDEPIHGLFRSGAAVPAFTVFQKGRDESKLWTWMQSLREDWLNSTALTLRDSDTKRIYEAVAPRYAGSRLPILILGETGTGKESLARHFHKLSRPQSVLLSVNCGGLESSLAFSELFGHTANAYTDASYNELGIVLRASGYKPGPRGPKAVNQSFEEWLRVGNPDLIEDKSGLLVSMGAQQAAGTLFLDEVATLPGKVMAGLLRVLSSNDVAPFGHHGPSIRAYCRLVAATNETSILEDSVSGTHDDAHKFRRDLCYRLGGAIITLAPLRERDPEDIKNYINKVVWGQLDDVQTMPIAEAAAIYIVDLYKARSDPSAKQYQLGNFRTLKNLIYRAALIARGDEGGEITRVHVEAAEKHGRLLVGQAESITHDAHIREVFVRRMEKLGLELDEDFSWDELKEITKGHPTRVACAFLECCLVMRTGERRGYYQSSEIQTSLTRGLALRAWLGKSLNREHVRDAAIEYFAVEGKDLLPEMQIASIVQKVRERSNGQQ